MLNKHIEEANMVLKNKEAQAEVLKSMKRVGDKSRELKLYTIFQQMDKIDLYKGDSLLALKAISGLTIPELVSQPSLVLDEIHKGLKVVANYLEQNNQEENK